MFYTEIHPTSDDVNRAGHVGFSTLPRWFEQGFEGIYQIINPQMDIKQGSVIVARLEVDYRAEVDGEGRVTIETGLGHMGSSSFILTQKMIQHDKTAAVSRVTMVYFDYTVKKPIPLPEDMRKRFKTHMVEYF
ncbi:acyl-CoA thioester hydrolase [Desulfocicer vacuolatum DSM 3385]|uniref:Acyl-CoA thioester hydrolase n=1 Tax=Desulfocicer vacuolatum DSM 3385 TaxID=1121400 RepID=A0A1W2ECS6_9BACT|nr:thioesterase family protein [Desulfocicer vacuolatum]SMD07554.1 acyl-CoA thioester hydrolase [Desulfocicer vacuolatum DSM 3385]